MASTRTIQEVIDELVLEHRDPMDQLIDDILAHHGIKGMKWGIRREDITSGSGRPQTVAEAARAEAYKSQARKHGVSTLTNEQLAELTKRLELEKKYNKWESDNPTLKARASAFLLNELKTEALHRVGFSDKGSHLRQIAEAVNGAHKQNSTPKVPKAKPTKPTKVNKRTVKKAARNPGVFNITTV